MVELAPIVHVVKLNKQNDFATVLTNAWSRRDYLLNLLVRATWIAGTSQAMTKTGRHHHGIDINP
jgi:hypothetical protein